jgi:ABC-type nickel/cobalt efflux system permease component RcnA
MRRTVLRLAALAAAVSFASIAAHAASSPFGIATPDTSGGGSYFGGPLGPVFAWVAVHQAAFYRSLTAALTGLKQSAAGLWLFFGLSFAYGVFHAVGPGHGKAVISSYLMASGDSVKRGVALSFLSALVQAASAIVIVAIGTIVLRVTATTMTSATDGIEIASYALIAVFGGWLLWAKLRGGHHHHHHYHPVAVGAAHDCAHEHDDEHDHDHGHTHDPAAHASLDHTDHDHHPPASVPGAVRPGLTRAWSAVLSVGIRPCSGAIIILVFAWSQSLFAAGIAATLIMALGTGLTVAALATLAVSAKGVALRLAKGGTGGAVALRLARGIEIGGAAAVLLLGLFMLGGALSSAGLFAAS